MRDVPHSEPSVGNEWLAHDDIGMTGSKHPVNRVHSVMTLRIRLVGPEIRVGMAVKAWSVDLPDPIFGIAKTVVILYAWEG